MRRRVASGGGSSGWEVEVEVEVKYDGCECVLFWLLLSIWCERRVAL
jgi:hypothetical protein